MVEFLRFLFDYHILEIVPFALIMLYLSISNRRSKGRQNRSHSNRTTARTSEYYSTEIDELKR
jgi:hypothetical protein